MRGDIFALYGIDPVDYLEQHENVDLIYILIERLAYEPMSIYRAKQLGDDSFIGWSADSNRLADLLDAVHFAAVTGAMQKGKFKNVAQRPEAKNLKKTATRVTTKARDFAKSLAAQFS